MLTTATSKRRCKKKKKCRRCSGFNYAMTFPELTLMILLHLKNSTNDCLVLFKVLAQDHDAWLGTNMFWWVSGEEDKVFGSEGQSRMRCFPTHDTYYPCEKLLGTYHQTKWICGSIASERAFHFSIAGRDGWDKNTSFVNKWSFSDRFSEIG